MKSIDKLFKDPNVDHVTPCLPSYGYTLRRCTTRRKVITCTGADGLLANDMSQQVILVKSRTIRSHRNRFLIICRPNVDNLIVSVGI